MKLTKNELAIRFYKLLQVRFFKNIFTTTDYAKKSM